MSYPKSRLSVGRRRARCAASVVAWCCATHLAFSQVYTLTRFAGMPAGGRVDGTGPEAQFSSPGNVAADHAGNIFVADGPIVRQVSPAGVVTTLTTVPTGRTAGFATDGTWTGRLLGSPGIAVDGRGNVFFADNHAIWKIAPSGATTLIAGNPGEIGVRDGTCRDARFDFSVPASDFFPDRGFGNIGLVVTDAGLLFVTDPGNDRIRRIGSNGEVTTLAGGGRGLRDGTGEAARFNQPERLALDAEGNLWVADVGNESIRRVTPDGQVTTIGAKISRVATVAVGDDGSVYAGTATWYADNADYAHAAIYRLEITGQKVLLAGSEAFAGADDGIAGAARFNSPLGLTVTGNGNVIVADAGNHAVRRVTPMGEVSTLAGAPPMHADGTGDRARFHSIRKMTRDAAGNLYVLDDAFVRKITPDRVVTTLTNNPRLGSWPGGIAADRKGNVVVSSGMALFQVAPDGTINALWPATGARGPVTLPPFIRESQAMLSDVVLDSSGVAFVATAGAVLKFVPNSNPVVVGNDPLAGRAGGVLGPDLYLSIDAHDTLLLADSWNGVVRRIGADGAMSTLAGEAGKGGWADGTVAEARFSWPRFATTDAQGSVLVFDTGVVRKVANGVVSTLTLLPPAGLDTFYDARGLVAGDSDCFFFVDASGALIWKATPVTADERTGLVNLSVQAVVAPEQPLTVGITTEGGQTTLLLRGVGPGLEAFVAGADLAQDPRLDLLTPSGGTLWSYGRWSDRPALITAAIAAGAFPLPRGSSDAVGLHTLERPALLRLGVGSPGLAMLEVFALPRFGGGRVTNLSARHLLARNASLIAGFAVQGKATDVLIRGIGPTLRAFGIADPIGGAVLTVFDGFGRVLATNARWPSTLSPVFTRIGAFALETGSRDAAVRLTLPAGAYTATLVASDGAAGQALIEIYEVPGAADFSAHKDGK